jgi:pyrroline-5-carboxylate reductase
MKQGFIGYGNLANAVYQGLKEDRSIEFAYYARNRKNVDLHYFQDMESLVLYADVIWLAVKPQDLAGVLEQLKKSDLSEKTIISPVAGKSIAYIERYLGNKTTIIRIMPNLAMAFKASVTAFRSNKPDSEKSEIIFNLLGKTWKSS